MHTPIKRMLVAIGAAAPLDKSAAVRSRLATPDLVAASSTSSVATNSRPPSRLQAMHPAGSNASFSKRKPV